MKNEHWKFTTIALIAAFACCLGAAGVRLWSVGDVVFEPGIDDSFDSVAVKDPSVVRHGGLWHLFYTARSRSEYTIGYASSERLSGFRDAERLQLTKLHGANSKYAAAPQVFFFRPQHKWYLIFQTTDANYQPVYSTTSDINDPNSWTEPQPLVNKTEPAKWIDFWVICDEHTAYLFFTREHRDVVVMTTRIEKFPSGFGVPTTVFAPVHEAVHVYRVRGTNPPEYLMLYEQQETGDLRHFGLARARSPEGNWKIVEERFASSDRLSGKSGERWTDEVSHGELLRSGADELLEVPRDRWELLIQGMRQPAHRGEYPMLPWKLGLITMPAR